MTIAVDDRVRIRGRRGTFRVVEAINPPSGPGFRVVEINPASKGRGEAVSGLYNVAADRVRKAGRR